MKSFFVLRSGRRGANKPATVGVLDDSWFTRPTNERRSERLVGMGNFEMASVMESSTRYPAADRWNPAKLTSVLAKSHFPVFNVIFLSEHRRRNWRTWSVC